MKKIFIIILLFFSSCGFNSIYVNKNLKNLEFYEIALEGDARINKINAFSLFSLGIVGKQCVLTDHMCKQ